MHHVRVPGVRDVSLRFVYDKLVEEDTVLQCETTYYHNTVEGLTPLRESLEKEVGDTEESIAEREKAGNDTGWTRCKLTALQGRLEEVNAAIERLQAVSEPGVIPQDAAAYGPHPAGVTCEMRHAQR